MSYLVTFEAVDPDGRVIFTETVPSTIEPLVQIGKTMHVLGQAVELRISFDPGLVPEASS